MTLSIAVATKRAGISLTLRSKAHDLIEVRPTGEWLDREWIEDVVVLDLETADKTRSAIEELRSTQQDRPIVVVAGDGEHWDDLKNHFSHLLVVPLPVTAATLLDTVERAAALARPLPLPVPIPASPAPVDAADPEELDDEPLIAVLSRPERNLDQSGSGPAQEVVKPANRRPPKQGPPRHKASGRGGRTSVTSAPIPSTPESPLGVRLIHHIDDLLKDVALLPRIAQTAEVVRHHAIDATPADASVVLVPDADVWRVEAGENLRPLEERLQIDATHWLVAEIASSHRGLMIKNTDIARNRLAGAPLASRAHWLAVPVGNSEVIVVLTRDDKTFSKNDVGRTARAVSHLDDEIRHAIAVRALARALSEFQDLVD